MENHILFQPNDLAEEKKELEGVRRSACLSSKPQKRYSEWDDDYNESFYYLETQSEHDEREGNHLLPNVALVVTIFEGIIEPMEEPEEESIEEVEEKEEEEPMAEVEEKEEEEPMEEVEEKVGEENKGVV